MLYASTKQRKLKISKHNYNDNCLTSIKYIFFNGYCFPNKQAGAWGKREERWLKDTKTLKIFINSYLFIFWEGSPV